MIHKCSPCGKEFKTEVEYLNHQCEKADGARPTEKEFLRKTTMPYFNKVSKEALSRGEEIEKQK